MVCNIFIFHLRYNINYNNKKRTYCANFCPLGTLSDAFSSKENKKFLKLPKSIQYLTFIVFFLYIFFIIYYNWGNTFCFGQSYLSLSFLSYLSH
ncbi:4Fe-4S binding protein [Caloramator sp. Dgby_cultured_2]|uniref:4Fe-4S binding protein n=1 Tax=Caloramator sp. Dgby_cultured_2 TaxID=3029174 RepID=UPI00406C6634